MKQVMIMDSGRQQQWNEILSMTDEMLLMSKSADLMKEQQPWPDISEMAAKRMDLLEQFFKREVAESDATEVAEGIQHIIDSDNQLYASGLNIQKQIHSSLTTISDQRKASNAYSQTAHRSTR